MKTDISGKYIIDVVQPIGISQVDYQIKGKLELSGDNIVTGVAIFERTVLENVLDKHALKKMFGTKKGKIKIVLTGAIIQGYIQFHYAQVLPNTPQFGSGLLQIQEEGVLSGQFLGYSPVNQQIITGSLIFRRIE